MLLTVMCITPLIEALYLDSLKTAQKADNHAVSQLLQNTNLATVLLSALALLHQCWRRSLPLQKACTAAAIAPHSESTARQQEHLAPFCLLL